MMMTDLLKEKPANFESVALGCVGGLTADERKRLLDHYAAPMTIDELKAITGQARPLTLHSKLGKCIATQSGWTPGKLDFADLVVTTYRKKGEPTRYELRPEILKALLELA
jgi:hypothetical protein